MPTCSWCSFDSFLFHSLVRIFSGLWNQHQHSGLPVFALLRQQERTYTARSGRGRSDNRSECCKNKTQPQSALLQVTISRMLTSGEATKARWVGYWRQTLCCTLQWWSSSRWWQVAVCCTFSAQRQVQHSAERRRAEPRTKSSPAAKEHGLRQLQLPLCRQSLMNTQLLPVLLC